MVPRHVPPTPRPTIISLAAVRLGPYPPDAGKDDQRAVERACWKPSKIGDDPHGEKVVD